MKILAIGGSGGMGRHAVCAAQHFDDVEQIVVADLNEASARNFADQLDKKDNLNSYEDITTYNNFYEFGMGKTDPSENSGNFKPKPWSISIEGLVNSPQIIDLENLLKTVSIEDRVYRLRCVEAWSMVIPWQGFSLSELIKI